MTDVRGTAERIAARHLVEEHIRIYGYVPHPDRMKDAISSALLAAEAAGMEKAAKVAEGFYGGKAHTYASENADLYRAQDCACHDIAAAIRKEADNGR